MNQTQTPPARPRATRWRLTVAFFCLYIIWGSTYLSIKICVQTMPPFLMAAARFFIAGGLLAAWQLGVRRAPLPGPAQWWAAFVTGTCLLLGGNGMVVWAITHYHLPSGVAALLVGATPFYMTLLGWLWRGGPRPNLATFTGLVLGFGGLALLVLPEALAKSHHTIHPLGAALVLAAALSWSIGSLYSKDAPMPAQPLLSNGLVMLGGGASILLLATLTGEWSRLHLASIAPAAWWNFVFLIFLGSIVAFSSYIYLLNHTRPAVAATYAYVNPVVALALGWAFGGEQLGTRTLVAAAIIVGSVALITIAGEKRPPTDSAPEDRSANPSDHSTPGAAARK